MLNFSDSNEIGNLQGHSQNLKEVLQNFTEVFNIDNVRANTKKLKFQKRKNKLEFHSNH